MNVTNSEGRRLGAKKVLGSSNNLASRELHENDDVDVDAGSHHHTIGEGPWQAAPGAKFKELKELVDFLISTGVPGATVPANTVFPASAPTYIWNHGLNRPVIAYALDSSEKEINCGKTQVTPNQLQIFLSIGVSFPVTLIAF